MTLLRPRLHRSIVCQFFFSSLSVCFLFGVGFWLDFGWDLEPIDFFFVHFDCQNGNKRLFGVYFCIGANCNYINCNKFKRISLGVYVEGGRLVSDFCFGCC